MGILKRIRNIVMADIHGTLDKLESPINMLQQYIRETEEQIVKAQQALSQQLYLEKKYETLIAETEALAAKRNRQAELAVSRNEDNIAQLALQEKIKNENKTTLYREQYEATKKQTAALYEQINKLQEKYQELQHKKLILVSRLNTAQAIKTSNTVLSSFDTENAVKGFARIEAQVQKLEAEAAASNYFHQLQHTTKTQVLDQQLQEEVQQALEHLKASK